MTNQVLSIEKMRHLQELGVDMSDASIYWIKRSHNPNIEDESKKDWFLSLQKEFMTFGHIAYKVLPTFTLQDIIEKLPKMINKDDNFYKMYIETTTKGNWTIYYKANVKKPVLVEGKNLMEVMYQMLCWCAESGYLKGE